MGGCAGFPRAARLNDAADFRRVFNRCQCKSSDRFLTILALRNSGRHARLGMAISRKAVKSAVARNRIKRIVRDSFRHHQTQLGNLDLVVLARPGIARQANPDLRRALETHWKRLQATCDDC